MRVQHAGARSCVDSHKCKWSLDVTWVSRNFLYKALQNRQPKTFAVWDDSRACNQHRLEVVYLLYLSRFSSHLLNQSGVYGLSMFQSSLKFLNAWCLCLCQSLTADYIAGARPESVPHSLAQVASLNGETGWKVETCWNIERIPEGICFEACTSMELLTRSSCTPRFELPYISHHFLIIF